ncbi:hypothetical protein D3C75_1366150 [compost metagenome]
MVCRLTGSKSALVVKYGLLLPFQFFITVSEALINSSGVVGTFRLFCFRISLRMLNSPSLAISTQ